MTQPIEIIARSLVRERNRAGLSLGELARRANIAKSTLSQLETGKGNPGLETLWALCVALNIPFATLLEPQPVLMQVIRRGDGVKVTAGHANYDAILLATCPPGARRDIYSLQAEPGAARCSEPHAPGSVEHIIITRGRALVGLTEMPEELNVGDYICYPGDRPHIFKALDPGTLAVMIVEQN
ncbi:helix-turn-helix domain-containing protein [Klebsiella sp. BIGb0407]|uniref:helix-turn-helix domain-containing protein n=1 Tax=Klebsiella sp. BIGb0407 TaxID=2940603 RepID=UPI00216814BA|nr:XRE family transcriptional regulator [Klebsiella sp. BIGb0407]MCS3429771.1 transcriptional regulator with XRE-family HTH domain [Klebsiella sp. BIGb0407]